MAERPSASEYTTITRSLRSAACLRAHLATMSPIMLLLLVSVLLAALTPSWAHAPQTVLRWEPIAVLAKPYGGAASIGDLAAVGVC